MLEVVLGQQKYKDESFKFLKYASQFASAEVTEAPPVSETFPGGSERVLKAHSVNYVKHLGT